MSNTKKLLSVLLFCITAFLSVHAAQAAQAPEIVPQTQDPLGTGITTSANDYIIPPGTDPSQTPTVPNVPASSSPSAPVISYSDVPESNYVAVHIYPPEGVQLSAKDVIAYRINDDEFWHQYITTIELSQNSIIHAVIIFADGSRSPEATMAVNSIDGVPPTAPTVKADLKTWVKDYLPVELADGTDTDSGYLRSEYRIGADGQWTEYTGQFKITSACVLYVRGVDKAGNYSEPVSVKINNFDTAPPDLSSANIVLSSTGGFVASESNTFSKIFKGDVSFTVSGVRDDESGLAYYEYQTVGSSSKLSDTKWKRCELKDSPVIKGDFTGYVFIRAVDKVGNVSGNITSEGFIIDVTPPVISNISLSPSTTTNGRVTIKFSITDNSQISEVTVNGTYVGAYSTSYTVYRNGDYLIKAIDAAGNVAGQNVTVKNINATPYTLLETFQQMNENSFTPSSYAEAKSAALGLQGQLDVGASEAKIQASYERLLAAMEALVPKGDGTASMALIGRIETDYKKEDYTESSWNAVERNKNELLKLLDDPERTQEQVDNARRSLETALVDLVPKGNFDALDTLISQCDALDPALYDKLKYAAMLEALNKAKELPRDDSSQEEIDLAYQLLLTSMVELKDAPKKEGFSFTLVFFVIIALLIIAIGVALFIVNRRMRAEKENEEAEEEMEQEGEPEDYPEVLPPPVQSVGDLYFTDDDDDDQYDGEYIEPNNEETGLIEDQSGIDGYIGHKKKRR